VGKPLLSTLIQDVEQMLKGLNRQGMSYNVEIKSGPEEEKKGYVPDYKDFADLVIKELQVLPPERYTIQSFDWRVLKYLNEKYPRVRLSALRENPFKVEKIKGELGFLPQVFSPYHGLLNEQIVKDLHQL